VVRAEPAKFTTEAEPKFVPLTVIVKPESPTVFASGEMLVVVGEALLTVNVWALDVPPPGVGFTTVIANVPAVVMSDDGIEAVTLEDETNDVARGDPSKLTTEDAVKPVPVTVIVKVEAPTAFELGEMSDVVGAGLLTVKVWLFDVPPPGVGFVTVIANVPAVVKSDVTIEAVRVEDETKLVVRADPSKLTVDDALKPVPSTVIVKVVLPTVFDVGEIELVVGTGFTTVKVCAFEVPPPGVGLKTVTACVPAVPMSTSRIATVSCVTDT